MLQIKKVGISADKKTKINMKSQNTKKEFNISVQSNRQNEENKPLHGAEEFGEFDEVKEWKEHHMMRCEALESGRLDILERVKKIRGTIKTKELQMENITKEQQKIKNFMKNLDGRINSLENHKNSYLDKVTKWKEKEMQQLDKLKLIEATISSLKKQNNQPMKHY